MKKRSDDMDRGKSPDKNRNIHRGDDDMNIERDKNRRGQRGTGHDKEDIEKQNE